MSKYVGLPVHGYQSQPETAVSLVNGNKNIEETILRLIDSLSDPATGYDLRWLAIGRSHIEQGFMAINRAIFKPTRVLLDEDTHA